MESKKPKFEMRDMFNIENIYLLSKRIKFNYSNFKQDEFNNKIKLKLIDLSLMDRSLLIQETLEEFLPNDFEKIVEIILKSQLPELSNDNSDNYPSDFIAVPQSNLIAKLGCNKKNFNLSMDAQFEITKRFSCEWSIHNFIEKFEDESFIYLKKWAKNENCHVRRLCSEGIRPRLPWSKNFKKFQKNPVRLFEILDLLYFDGNRYVIRSICNCLNDISKTHPNLVILKLKEWGKTNKQNKKEFEWMKKHSLRTLIKKGHLETLDYLGFKQSLNLNCNLSIKTPVVNLGESLEFELKIKSMENINKILIDYIIYFVKSNEKLSPKVFKLKELKIEKNNIIIINKKYLFKKMTTRKLYSGIHKIAIQINGKIYAEKKFMFKNI